MLKRMRKAKINAPDWFSHEKPILKTRFSSPKGLGSSMLKEIGSTEESGYGTLDLHAPINVPQLGSTVVFRGAYFLIATIS